MNRFIAAFSISALFLSACSSSYKGPRSDHFDGEHFKNQSAIQHKDFFDFISWMINREPGEWSKNTHNTPYPAPPHRSSQLHITFINHATLLIQVDNVNILTDPIWSERASPLSWVGPKRVRAAGIALSELPPIDFVIISHNHYDHMDLPTLHKLKQLFNPTFYVGLGNKTFLNDEKIEPVVELDWWENSTIKNQLQIHSVPAQHFSARGILDRDKTLWTGYVIETSQGPVYFAGDTGFGPHFSQIRQRFGPVKAALLPIGAFLPRWFMAPVHISPSEAIDVHRLLNAEYSIAMHFGTFALADDAQYQPVEELIIARDRHGIPENDFLLLDFGEGKTLLSK